MRRLRLDEAGDSLVEIVFAVVIIGLISTGFFTAVMTSQSASKAHRDMVTADGVLRDYAEAAKQAVRDKPCTAGNANSTFTVPYSPPAGYTITATGPNGITCPAIGGTNQIDISAATPSGLNRDLTIKVRTP